MSANFSFAWEGSYRSPLFKRWTLLLWTITNRFNQYPSQNTQFLHPPTVCTHFISPI